MKRGKLVIFLSVFYLVSVLLAGCTTVKEWGKGFLGVSTRVLEENRQNDLKKSFALDYDACYAGVKSVLNEKGKESYIYAEDLQAKMIAVYFSQTDVTAVGIFFTPQENGGTLMEISSPSTFAKEDLGKRIFAALTALVKAKNKEKGNGVKK